MTKFQKTLDTLKEQNRYRSLSLPGGIDLSSNDYLGLSSHPDLKQAAREALDSSILMGSGGSRLLRGHHEQHENLERFAASHYGFERTLYFASGFQANYALFTTLPTRHDIVIYDEYLHASALDGIHASHAKRVKARHNDLQSFEEALKRSREKAQNLYIAVESLYSMDGDFAPLSDLLNLANIYDAHLIIDEAHSTGVYGARGEGLCANLPKERLIVLHTCGKALGVAGGLLCGSEILIDYFINKARPFIYSTAPPPLQAYLTQKAIEICASTDEQNRRDHLKKLCDFAHNKIGGSGSQIIPVILHEDEKAVNAAQGLQDMGYDIRAIRPPTVPAGTSRLRLSLNATLTFEALDEFYSHLQPFLIEKAA